MSNGNSKRIKLSIGNGTDNNCEFRSTNNNTDDDFAHMLNDPEDDKLLSQAVSQAITTNGTLDTNYANLFTDNGLNGHKEVQHCDDRASDVPMTSDNSSDIEDRDAIMGKIKILEANKNRTEKEYKELKVKFILLTNSKKEMEEEYKRRMSDHMSHTKSIDGFRLNDIKQYEITIAELENKIRKMIESDGRNAPQVMFGTDLHKQRKEMPGFSKQMLDDFYSPLQTQNSKSQKMNVNVLAPPTQTSQSIVSNVLVPATQTTMSSSTPTFDAFKSPFVPKSKGRFNNPLPFSPQEIPSTQFSQIQSFSSEPTIVPQTQQMSEHSVEAMSVDSNDENSEQTISQNSQLNHTQKHKEINDQLSNNWKSMHHLIHSFRIVDQFDTNWIRDTEQTLAWCKSFVEINANVVNL